MFDLEEEMKIRRIKLECINSVIKSDLVEKSGKLGFRQVDKERKDNKINDVSFETFKKIQKG